MSFHFKTTMLQRLLGSKIEKKFGTFLTRYKIQETSDLCV